AERAASMIAPLIVGAIATYLFWQAVYFAIAPFAFVLAFYFWFRLREPVRGEMERRAMGGSGAVALTAEKPPSFGGALRIACAVKTARRTFYALPFVVGSVASIATLLSFYEQQKFGLGPGARGLLQSISAPFSIAGVLVGGVVANRVMRYRPGRI